MLHPDGIAGVIPTTRSFCRAISKSVCPKTSCHNGSGCCVALVEVVLSPVSTLNSPGACHNVWSFSAGAYPLPFLVTICNTFGPLWFFISLNIRTKYTTSCPSAGPKYRIFNPWKMLVGCLVRKVLRLLCRSNTLRFFLSSIRCSLTAKR